ncbi:TlpA disulfide reductase family protein [Paenibacillus sp.]|jgi:thiol-disulfide isomerase/thioredoxin|uniref:TlpA family protein disulfide reductase n=1 Tax=Paenibacillus sp. TaxID=58172 RepID=UPI00281B78EB|nr:TlpA disulfide reductase family protein [Paenibacillus sp.]MDR0270636.1 TlpA family protein disulfide reductase [Paenibacillus sp.]
MKRNLYILLGVIILVGIAIYQNAGPGIQSVFQHEKPMPTEMGPKAGLLAPAFTAQGLDDKEYHVGGEQDKAILLNFWASWCGPCQQEAPELNALAEKYKDSLNIYGVNVTKYDNKKNAQSFIEKYHLNFPVMLDLNGDIYEKQYKGIAFPTNVLINKHGVVQEVVVGILSPKELEKKVKDLTKS